MQAQDTEAPGAEPSAALNLNVAADAAAAPSEDAAPQASTSTPGAAHADVQLALQHCNSRLQKAYSDLDIEKEAHCRTRQYAPSLPHVSIYCTFCQIRWKAGYRYPP